MARVEPESAARRIMRTPSSVFLSMPLPVIWVTPNRIMPGMNLAVGDDFPAL
jgi:hypothetical protein